MQLPKNFRAAEVFAFHARDPQQRAERVTGHDIDKGLMWRGLNPDGTLKSFVVVRSGDQHVAAGKHPGVERVVLCEIDERVTRLAEKYFPELCEANGDPRAELLVAAAQLVTERVDLGSFAPRRRGRWGFHLLRRRGRRGGLLRAYRLGYRVHHHRRRYQ